MGRIRIHHRSAAGDIANAAQIHKTLAREKFKESTVKENMKIVCEDENFRKSTKYISYFKDEKKKYLIMKLMEKKAYGMLYLVNKTYYSIKEGWR